MRYNTEYTLGKPITLAQSIGLLSYYKSLGWTLSSASGNTTVEKLANEYQGYNIFFRPTDKYISYCRIVATGRVVVSFEKAFNLPKSFTPVEVKLNDEHTATVKANGEVTVGCQTFPANVILQLAKEVQKSLDFDKN